MHQHSNYTGARRRREKKGLKNFFEAVIVEILPNMEKETVKSKRCKESSTINPRKNLLIHTLIKLTKIKHKERILKAAREKSTSNTQGKSHTFNSLSFSRNSVG